MNGTWETTKSNQLHKSVQNFHQQTPNFNNRKRGIITTRLRTDHTKLTHEHKIKKTTPSTCIHCNNHPLTITHILHECHTTETQRQRYGINANQHKPNFSKWRTKSIKISQKSNGIVVANDLTVETLKKKKKEEERADFCADVFGYLWNLWKAKNCFCYVLSQSMWYLTHFCTFCQTKYW